MIIPVIKKSKKLTFLTVIILLSLPHYGFKYAVDEQQLLAWSNRCFTESFDPSGEAKLKSWEFTLTGDAFVRLRKVYTNGKQEYYSLHLHRFNEMNYLGTVTNGTLQLKAVADDIIVQTYNDRKGDVDSMSTELDIPVKNMEPERLDSLQMVLNYFKNK